MIALLTALVIVSTAIQAYAFWRVYQVSRALSNFSDQTLRVNGSVTMLVDAVESGFGALYAELVAVRGAEGAPPAKKARTRSAANPASGTAKRSNASARRRSHGYQDPTDAHLAAALSAPVPAPVPRLHGARELRG